MLQALVLASALLIQQQPGTLQGTLTESAGNVVPRARVVLLNTSISPVSLHKTSTLSDGTFRFVNLSAGIYCLAFSRDSHRYSTHCGVRVVPAASTTSNATWNENSDADDQDLGELSGAVSDPDAAPISHATVLVISGAQTGEGRSVVASEDGTFKIEALASGDYFIVAESFGFDTAVYKARVEAGKGTKADVALSTKGSSGISVDSATGDKIATTPHASQPKPKH